MSWRLLRQAALLGVLAAPAAARAEEPPEDPPTEVGEPEAPPADAPSSGDPSEEPVEAPSSDGGVRDDEEPSEEEPSRESGDEDIPEVEADVEAEETDDSEEATDEDEEPADEDEEPADEDEAPAWVPPTEEELAAMGPKERRKAERKAKRMARAARPPKPWGAIVLPLIGVNSIDGLGLGLGGEVYKRLPDGQLGYRQKFTFSTYLTTSLQYQSHSLQWDYRGDIWVLARIEYRQWTNYVYGGPGGGNVLLLRPELEAGNGLIQPLAMVSISKPMQGFNLYGQWALRWNKVDPAPGSLLTRMRPTGIRGGTYTDLTFGIEHDSTDRLPVPGRGIRAELDVRAGGLFETGTGNVYPLVGLHGEAMGWAPLAGERLVLGARLLAERSFGNRPFFEQNITGGRWRDELGYDQALTGYGRTRSRGDGVVAALLELRSFLVRSNHKFFDIALFMSVFAEEAWLFDRWDPGPHLPTLGFGPVILWQGAAQLRPFLAWGWRAEDPTDPRRPVMQFGLALVDTL